MEIMVEEKKESSCSFGRRREQEEVLMVGGGGSEYQQEVRVVAVTEISGGRGVGFILGQGCGSCEPDGV